MLEKLKSFLQRLSDKTGINPGVLFILGFGAILVLLTLLFVATSSNRQQQADEFVPFYGPAILLEAEELIAELGEDGFSLLREDIKFFAREKLEEYKTGDAEVVFTVDTFSSNQDEIKIIGSYEKRRGEVEIGVIKKSYGVIQTLITTPDFSSEGIQLPSQSPELKFIGSLPVKEAAFSVDYLPKSDTFYIVFTTSITDQSVENVRRFFREKLQTDDLTLYNFSAVGFDSAGEIQSAQIVPKETE